MMKNEATEPETHPAASGRVDPLVMPDFETDLEKTFGEKMKSDDEFCSQVWSALANKIWKHDAFERDEEYSCTSRYAGGLIADIIGRGSYMDWYCSGPYATVSDEIESAMKAIGWTHHDYEA